MKIMVLLGSVTFVVCNKDVNIRGTTNSVKEFLTRFLLSRKNYALAVVARDKSNFFYC